MEELLTPTTMTILGVVGAVLAIKVASKLLKALVVVGLIAGAVYYYYNYVAVV